MVTIISESETQTDFWL